MCGIVGYIGNKPAVPILIDGLERLEYRGYDSAGVAVFDDSYRSIQVLKRQGRLSILAEAVNGNVSESTVGIGHTRWATHGRPSDENAHPHSDCTGRFVVVHNGIIENYLEIKERLAGSGHLFRSETDTEVIAHLLEEVYEGDMEEAIQKAAALLRGSYAVTAICSDDPERLFAVRNESPMVIGVGRDENFIASDIPAILQHTRDIHVLNTGDFCTVDRSGVTIRDKNGKNVNRQLLQVQWDSGSAERGGYDHFMLKEIHEQPRAIKDTLTGRIDPDTGEVNLEELSISKEEAKALNRVNIVACGTAYHAGLVGKYALEKLARIPVEVQLASEFRYSDPFLSDDMLTIVISQSGETADTLAAIKESRDKGCRVLAITNVVGSSVSREADDVIYTWAGPEIAVASTKAYTTQLVSLYLLAIRLGRLRGTLSRDQALHLTPYLRELPEKAQRVISEQEEAIRELGKRIGSCPDVFFIGRGLDYAVSQEAQLKLKEISYIHAEALAAGELKHGTLALVVEGVPVVAVVTQEQIYDKTVSNIKEVKARDAEVIALASEADTRIGKEVDQVIPLPDTEDIFMPVIAVIPTQMLAYYAAVARGCDVDKPRNLAKSVTVE